VINKDVLLDLSSAFDTIDHDILLDRLCNRYGLSGVVLDWLNFSLISAITLSASS
jgi:hypothetical protein